MQAETSTPIVEGVNASETGDDPHSSNTSSKASERSKRCAEKGSFPHRLKAETAQMFRKKSENGPDVTFKE